MIQRFRRFLARLAERIAGKGGRMIPIDLSGKTALITGVGDNESFAWFIAKTLQAAGARLVLAVHPRMIRIVEGFLSGDAPDDIESRKLPYGGGSLKVEKLLPCDVSYDTLADVPEATRNDRRYKRVEEQYGDYSIEGLMKTVKDSHGGIDILIHSVAFAPEIKSKLVDTTRAGYWTAISISAYSLVGLVRAALPLMENRSDGGAVVGLTYLGGARVVPHYGGGMSTAKAALQIDAKQPAVVLRLNEGGHPAVGGQRLGNLPLRCAGDLEAAITARQAHAQQTRLRQRAKVIEIGAGQLVADLGIGAKHRFADASGRRDDLRFPLVTIRNIRRRWQADRVGSAGSVTAIVLAHSSASPLIRIQVSSRPVYSVP